MNEDCELKSLILKISQPEQSNRRKVPYLERALALGPHLLFDADLSSSSYKLK